MKRVKSENNIRISRIVILFVCEFFISMNLYADSPLASWSQPPANISGQEQDPNRPSLSVAKDGKKAIAIWIASDSSVMSSVASITNNTAIWGQVSILPSHASKEKSQPTVVISSNGSRATAIWVNLEGKVESASALIDGKTATWSEALTLSGSDAYAPQVRLSTDGSKAIAIWAKKVINGGATYGFVETSSAKIIGNSASWGAAYELAPGGDYLREPQIGLSSDGTKAIAVWTYGVMNTRGLRSSAAVISDSSTQWGSIEDVHMADGTLNGSVTVPQIGLSSDGKQATAIWYRSRNTDIYGTDVIESASATISGLSLKWGAATYICPDCTKFEPNQKLAISEDGTKAVAIWNRATWGMFEIQTVSGNIQGQSAAWSTPKSISSGGPFSWVGGDTQIALSSDGAIAVAIWDRRDDVVPNIQVASGWISGVNSSWSTAENLDSNSGHELQIGISANGSQVVSVWTSRKIQPDLTSSYNISSSTAFIPYGVTLNVSKPANGDVYSEPNGISCGEACSSRFNDDSTVKLNAVPVVGYKFDGWTGACSGTNECSVKMDSDKNVGATFSAAPVSLAVTKSGSGTITSIPSGISCGITCNASFAKDSIVSLLAQPDYGFAFAGWRGVCAGAGTCIVTMDGDKSASANFIELPKYPVKATKPSTGVISSEPVGIVCGGSNRQCSSSFSSAKLTATPNAGYEFIKWNGCQAPEGNVCYIKPTSKMTVSAVFKVLPKYTVKITKNNLGSIISSPGGLNCPDKKKSCSVKFVKGTQATLTAVPLVGRSFLGWSGACSGTDSCTLLIDGNKGVGATFQ